MTLQYIEDQGEPRVEWMAVLAFVSDRKRVTAREVAEGMELGTWIECRETRGGVERTVTRHTGAAEAGTRLKRLALWGMVRRSREAIQVTARPRKDGTPSTRESHTIIYEITPYGQEVLNNPTVGTRARRPKGRSSKGKDSHGRESP